MIYIFFNSVRCEKSKWLPLKVGVNDKRLGQADTSKMGVCKWMVL